LAKLWDSSPPPPIFIFIFTNFVFFTFFSIKSMDF
jgi:hypothetical protein